jgi:molecular chaperone GrpE (heat shock protein)
MSSSADEFGWSAFSPRPAGSDEVELRSPAQELAAVLRRYQQVLQDERTEGQRAVERVLAVAADQAALVFRLGAVLAEYAETLRSAGAEDALKKLTIVRNQMADAVNGLGLTVVDPVGWPFDEAEHVDVVGWRHGTAFADEVVAETYEPIVLHNETVLRNGRVIMGAPQNGEERA